MPFRPALHAASFFSPLCAISKFELLCCGTHHFPTNPTRENLECERRHSVIFPPSREGSPPGRKKSSSSSTCIFFFFRTLKRALEWAAGKEASPPKTTLSTAQSVEGGKLQVVKTRTFVDHHELPRPEEIIRDQNSYSNRNKRKG